MQQISFQAKILETLFTCFDKFGLNYKEYNLTASPSIPAGYDCPHKTFYFGLGEDRKQTEEDVIFTVWHEFGHCMDHNSGKLLLKFQQWDWILTFKDHDFYYERSNWEKPNTAAEYCRLPEEASANAFAVLHSGLTKSPKNMPDHWLAGHERLERDKKYALIFEMESSLEPA